MKSAFLLLLSSLFLWSISVVSATADQLDVSTISCERLASAYDTKTEKELSFVNGVLNWMGGYHATEEQGTTVDWDKLSLAFDQTIQFCGSHPNVSVMAASEKFMGENISEATPNSFDLSLVTCENAMSKKSVLKNVGDTFMWLAGYHASYDNGSTIFDLDKFIKETSEVADYCTANPKAGLITVTDKFMSDN